MTLTYNLAKWFLFATHSLVMIIFCAKLFLNPTIHNKVIGRIRTGFPEVYAQSLGADCNLDLQPSGMVLVCDTSSCHDYHAKLFANPTMHNKDMGRTQTGFIEACAQS